MCRETPQKTAMVGLAPNEGCPDFTQLCQGLHLGLCLPPYPSSHTRTEPGSEQSDPPGPVPEAEKGQECQQTVIKEMKQATGCQSDFPGSASLSRSPGKGLGEMEQSVFASMETKREVRSRVPAEPAGHPEETSYSSCS